MKGFISTIASVFLAALPAQAQQPDLGNRRLSPEDVRMVAPALEKYTQAHLYGDIWKRPDLSRRDRSIVSLAVLITRNQFAPLNYYLGQALDNGVKPAEISEVIVHLAFYAGFANAFGAIGPARDVLAQRGIGADQLPKVSPDLLPLNEATEADGLSASATASARSRRGSSRTQRTSCSGTFGSGPTSSRGTG